MYLELTTEQQSAIARTHGSTSVTAQAGSGKTRVLVELAQNLIRLGTPVQRLLMFTFTEKSASEMQQRLLKGPLSPAHGALLNVGTIHGFCHRLLRQYGPLVDLDPGFTVMEEAESVMTRHRLLHQFLHPELELNPSGVLPLIEEIGQQRLRQSLLSTLNNPDFLNQIGKRFQTQQDNHLELCERFCALELNQHKRLARLSYDDLETLALELLHQEVSIRNSLLEHYRFILVDEFQDINERQAQLIDQLHDPTKNHLFIVGDPHQSIYRFRRARVEVFARKTAEIVANGGTQLTLSQSFRLPPLLATRINQVFGKLFDNYAPMQSALDGVSSVLTIVKAPREKTAIDRLRELEAEWIAHHIVALQEQGQQLNQCALLFRSSSHMDVYRRALEKLGIPSVLSRSRSLFEFTIITDLMHILNTLAGDQHPITQAGVLRGCFFHFSENFIERYFASNPQSLFGPYTLDLFLANPDQIEINRLDGLLKNWAALAQVIRPHQLYLRMVDDLMANHVVKEGLAVGTTVPQEQQALLAQLGHMIQGLEDSGVGNMREVMDSLNNLADSNEIIHSYQPGHSEHAVQLMTIHAAKGLEFDTIFLPNLYGQSRGQNQDSLYRPDVGLVLKREDQSRIFGLKPRLEEGPVFRELKAQDEQEECEETKRVLYVAMTRARRELILFLRPPSKKIVIEATQNFSDWLWTLLPEDCAQAVELTKYSRSAIEWSGLAHRMQQSIAGNQIGVDVSTKTSDPESLVLDEPPLDTKAPGHSQAIFSVSELESYFRCQKEYEIKYRSGIEPVLSLNPVTQNGSSTTIPAQKWGLVVHEVLQLLNWLDFSNQTTVIDQALRNHQTLDLDQRLAQRLTDIITNIRNDPTSHGSLTCDENSLVETPFHCRLDGYELRGVFDRVLKTKHGVTIVDYKTDHVTSFEEAQQRAEDYWGQLAAYALAAQILYGTNPTPATSPDTGSLVTTLLFVNGPYWIEHSWDQEELTQAKQRIGNALRELTSPAKFIGTHVKQVKVCRHCSFYPLNYCGVKNLMT